MRRISALALSLSLPLALMFSACPGPNQDFNVPPPDADTNPPDAAVEAEAGPPQPVKVMTWNVHNFYNDKLDSNLSNPADEIVYTTAEYQTKLGQVAGVVKSVKPDVLVLQEVENQAVVDDLATELGAYPHRYITQGNDPRGIDIAILSELPLQVAPTHKDEFFHPSTDQSQTFVFARDVLEAHFIINTRHVVLLGIHLKAQDGDPKSDLKRLAEAEQIRAIATGIKFDDASASVTVLGDFNDTPGSPPLTALMGSPPLQLTSAAAQVTASERYSVTFGGTPKLFDDQLSDPIAASQLDPASVTILHAGDVNLASDHDPVIATYMVN